VGREIYPDSIAYGKICDALPNGIDNTSAVLVRRYLGERWCCAIARAEARLPVGGVDTRDDDADSDLARPRFGHIAIDKPENGWVTGTGVDNRLHARDNLSIVESFQANFGLRQHGYGMTETSP